MRVSVSVNTKDLDKKLSKANLNNANRIVAGQMLMDMTPFVPMSNAKSRGTLRGSAHLIGTTLSWNTPYARRRFYEENVNFTTPGTGARWDNRAKAVNMDSWLRVLKKGIGL